MMPPEVNDLRLRGLLANLGYVRGSGWIACSEFDRLRAHRFALQQARDEMDVIGAFCLVRQGVKEAVISTPLVYVAVGADLAQAQEIHRRVWSQGLTPFLIIATPDHLVICQGFSYSQTDWAKVARLFTWDELGALPASQLDTIPFQTPAAEVWDLRAIRLRTSLFWRDHSIDVDGRVDRKLLESLNALSAVLIGGKGVSASLSPAAANGLIGRFLYVYFLADRGIIGQSWLEDRGHTDIRLSDQFVDWSCAATWRMFDDLDSIFNGSIFPLASDERAEIDATHINLVRRVMKHGAEPLRSGGVQLSFLDFYLGALRTETLSAVYEQFLENLKAGERRRAGAFYTPPYLVDFMLDRLEESTALSDGVSVLDPAAGSGVFLVGAYRRIIERARWTTSDLRLGVADLRGLLVRNIFGVERNRDACHVAAFSLYLTLLDYVDPRDLTRVAAGRDPEKLFPALIGRNLVAADFFARAAEVGTIPPRVDCIVGNPPWQMLSKLDSEAAIEWRDAHAKTAPIGNDQAAELFVWKCLQDRLTDTGMLAVLLPAKSFINPTSWSFRRELTKRYTVVGAANFAHLRYRLFASARQAVVAAFVRATPPTTRDKTWIYSPLSVSQPLARKEWPWTVLLDRADVQIIRHDTVARNPRGWFEAFMLRPVDRQIHGYLEDGVYTGKQATLQILGAAIGARVSRGGNPAETGVDRAYLVDAPLADDSSKSSKFALMNGAGLGEATLVDMLPESQLSNVRSSYRNRFGGNVLLIPRNMKNIRVVEYPLGFTSSTTALFFDRPASTITARELELLKAVGRFLRSDIGLYLIATTGRRWLMDRRNLEPEDLNALVVPITGLDDPRIDGINECRADALEDYLLRCLGLEEDLKSAVTEFLGFRMGFKDGDVPRMALVEPDDEFVQAYASVLRRNLAALLGRNDAFELKVRTDHRLGVGAIVAGFSREDQMRQVPAHLLAEQALQHYAISAENSFTNSLATHYDVETESVTVVKPLELFRWTIDSAFSDSRQILNAFMTGRP